MTRWPPETETPPPSITDASHRDIEPLQPREKWGRRGAGIPPRAAAIFGKLEAAQKVWRPGKIVIPETRRSMDVPLAYQNGVVNDVVSENLASSPQAEGRLLKRSFNSLQIHKHKIEDQTGNLVVLSFDEKAHPETEEKFAEVLRDFEVRFVPFGDAEKLADEVARTAH